MREPGTKREPPNVGARLSTSRRALGEPARAFVGAQNFLRASLLGRPHRQRWANGSPRLQLGSGSEEKRGKSYRGMGKRPYDDRIEARSIFSRKFINVRNVLKIRAFKSSVRGNPLVATRAKVSPLSVINRMISRCRSWGVFPSAVSRRIAEQPASSDNVKCRTHTPCSARAAGASFLQPAVWQRVPIGAQKGAVDR